jgi:competence protein ComEC
MVPLVAWSALAYAVGLLVALLGSSTGAAAGVVVLALAFAVAGVLRGMRAAPAVATLAAAGVLVGLATERADARCLADLALLSEWRATLDADAAPGEIARATFHAHGCTVRGAMLVGEGRARAGDQVRVDGVASGDRRGLFVHDAALHDAARSAALATIRARVGRRIDRLFGADAPIVRALVIADMSAVPAEQRDRFARAGLVHMLSVSGLHVGIIALALALLASTLRLPAVPARVGTLALLAAYVAAIGAPPPAVRAAVMLGVLLASRLLQRPTSPWAILAVGGAAPLVDPRVAVDLGWQLSVAGTAALVAGGSLARRIVPRRWPTLSRQLARGAAISVVATVVTAPLVAWTFGRVSLVGPLSNLVADPLMGLLQPVLFLALCIPIPAVQGLLADAAHALLAAFDAIATTAAAIPGAAPVVLPSTVAACAGAVTAIAIVVACSSRDPARAVIAALASLAVMVAEPVVHLRRGDTELHLIDVGQGDAIALRTRAGRWVLVDAGRSWQGGDAGRSTVVPYLAHRGGEVALFVLSHPHADHVGGAASVFAALHPARFLDPGYVGTTPPYRAALDAARVERIPWQRVHAGDSLVVDEVVITALAPDSAWAARLADANLASTVLLARVGSVRILLTGDAEGPEEEWILAHSPDALRADILKVGHHGSVTSTTAPFLAAVRPRLALVSVGAHNAYGHPDGEVLRALAAAGVLTLRTDRVGTIVVRTDGRRIEAEAGGTGWTIREPLTP